MVRISWNKFMEKYKKRVCFGFQVSKSLPANGKFDKSQKKLPTPYKLMQDWLSKNLNDEWSSTHVQKNLYVVTTSSKNDSKKLLKRFGFSGNPISNECSEISYSLDYSNSKYGKLAQELGYDV